MIGSRAEGSAVQPALTCREVVQVLRDVALGRLKMTRVGDQSWDEMNAELFLARVDNWTLAIFNDADELGYCDWCLDPSGRRWSSDSLSRRSSDPVALLSIWEHSELRRIVKGL